MRVDKNGPPRRKRYCTPVTLCLVVVFLGVVPMAVFGTPPEEWTLNLALVCAAATLVFDVARWRDGPRGD